MTPTDSVREKLDTKDGRVHLRVEKRRQNCVSKDFQDLDGTYTLLSPAFAPTVLCQLCFCAAENGFKWSLMDS